MLYFRTGFKKGTCGRPGGRQESRIRGSCGRVARLSSAKAPTAVRIRSGPPSPSEALAKEGIVLRSLGEGGNVSKKSEKVIHNG